MKHKKRLELQELESINHDIELFKVSKNSTVLDNTQKSPPAILTGKVTQQASEVVSDLSEKKGFVTFSGEQQTLDQREQKVQKNLKIQQR